MARLKVVSYAINGRGMGHLVRQLALLRQIRRVGSLLDVQCECWILTSSEADTLARREGIPALKMPSKAMLRDAGVDPARSLAILRGWVLNALAGLQPDLLLVDTFPGGSFGELLAALELARTRVLVARKVRDGFEADAAYQALLPLYDRVIIPDSRDVGPILIREREELPSRDEARRALGVPDGQRAVYLTLGGGGEVSAPDVLPRLVDALLARGWHVVVGAGPLYQGPERRGAGITWLDRYLAVELLPGVDAAVSAGGYNSFHELMHVGVPTVFLPLDRIADDQRERALRAVEAGAGRLARSLEEVPDLLESPGDAEVARSLVPGGGALAGAIAALGAVLPADDLRTAARVLRPEVVGILARSRLTDAPARLLELMRVLSGGSRRAGPPPRGAAGARRRRPRRRGPRAHRSRPRPPPLPGAGRGLGRPLRSGHPDSPRASPQVPGITGKRPAGGRRAPVPALGGLR
ncbi:MAG: glycosyltransferase [bacterium]